MNKKDLFEKMIQTAELNKCFTEYNGGSDVKNALTFVQKEFEKRMEDENKKRLHCYIVAARYKKVINFIFIYLKLYIKV